MQALLDAGLVLISLREHREVEWQALPQMVPAEDGRRTLPASRANHVPLMHSLTARRPEA